MSSRKMELLLKSPLGCTIVAVSEAGICIFGVVYNIYKASGGEIHSFAELRSCFTEDEVGMLVMGLLLFFVFMSCAKRARQMRKEEKEQEEQIERKEEKSVLYTFGLENNTITFHVPSGYWWYEDAEGSSDEELGFAISHSFWGEKGSPVVTCYLHVENDKELLQTGDYEDAEEIVRDNYELLSKREQKEIQIKHTKLKEKEVYYWVSGKKTKTIDAACNVGEGKVFEINITSSLREELSIEEFGEFFCFEEMHGI